MRKAERTELIGSKSKRRRRTIGLEALSVGISHPRGEVEVVEIVHAR
jgi:hypothetical protein